MPRGDRRGPEGLGPMTGRGLGVCAGYPAGFGAVEPGFARLGRGIGAGRGRGRGPGRGFGRGAGYGPGFGYAPPVWQAGDERSLLEARLEALDQENQWIKSRLDQLAGESKDQGAEG